MKSIFMLMLFISASAEANVSKICTKLAEETVAQSQINGHYDINGFETTSCELADNKAAIVCEVAAYKGNGDAVDTFRVILNKRCTRAFRVDLIGEE